MPVWFSVTSLRFCAHTIGNPVTAVVPAIAAPPFSTARRETRPLNNLPVRFILSSPILICRAARRQAHPVFAFVPSRPWPLLSGYASCAGRRPAPDRHYSPRCAAPANEILLIERHRGWRGAPASP